MRKLINQAFSDIAEYKEYLTKHKDDNRHVCIKEKPESFSSHYGYEITAFNDGKFEIAFTI